MLRTILESADYTEKSYDCWCPLTAPSYLENAVCRKSLIFKDFFRSPRLYVFGHCDHVFRSTEMLRTILELEDCAVKVKNIFDALKWFRHTFKVRVERDRQKIVFFFRSPWQYVFGHYDLVFRPTEMSCTILELADHTEKEGDMT